MTNKVTILLVGHGSRGPNGNRETLHFVAHWREQHPDWRIELCFIEYAEVLLDEGLNKAAQGAQKVVVLPFILNAAGHVKMELPHAVAAARLRHPAVEFIVTQHLGMGREIFSVLQNQLAGLMKSLAMPDPATTGVILLGRGSSDAGANGELAKMARYLYEDHEHELVDLAFTGVTWPRLETVVQRQAKLGMMQICIVPVYLFTGVLIERIQQQVGRLRQQYPQLAFAVGAQFAFDPHIFSLLDHRVAQAAESALAERQMLECDGCKYRVAAEKQHLHDHSHLHEHTHGHCQTSQHTHSHEHQHGHSHEHHI